MHASVCVYVSVCTRSRASSSVAVVVQSDESQHKHVRVRMCETCLTGQVQAGAKHGGFLPGQPAMFVFNLGGGHWVVQGGVVKNVTSIRTKCHTCASNTECS